MLADIVHTKHIPFIIIMPSTGSFQCIVPVARDTLSGYYEHRRYSQRNPRVQNLD
jgi:hypothetical protein